MHTQSQREVSPIPPGRYWIGITGGSNMRDFNAWVRDMHGAVKIEAASLDQSVSPPFEFIIFRVPEGRMPFLNALQFGFPNFAPPEVTSVQDVIQNDLNKNPEDVIVDVINKAGESASKAAEGFGGLLTLAFLVLLAGAAGAMSHR